MPLYDYKCQSCGHSFELRQSFSEVGETVCPRCSGISHRVFHSVPVLFKGSGFYSTDHKKGAANFSSNGKEEKTEAKAEPKPESKAEAKPESKTEDKPSSEKVAV